MKVNTGKSHLLISWNVIASPKFDNNYIASEKQQMLLGITIDSDLTFEIILIIFVKEQVKN